jgi:hypothetical protein
MRLLKIALMLLLMQSLTACCPAKAPQGLSHRTLFLTYYSTTPTDLEAITAAANEWRYATNSIATFDIRLVEQRPSHLEPTDVFVQMVQTNDTRLHGKDNLLGWYSWTNKTLYLIPDRLTTPDAYRTVVLHELSHVLMMHHSKIQIAIAYEFPLVGRRHITGDDQVAFCALYRCDPFALPTILFK